jgi:competence protein ComEC
MKKSFFFWIFLVILVVFRLIFSRQDFPDGKVLRISGRVLQEPVVYDNYQRISLENFKIYLPKFPEISYGDKVVIEGINQKGTIFNAKLVSLEKETIFLFSLRQKIIKVYRESLPEPHASLIAGITLGSKASLPASFWENLKKTGVAHAVVASGTNVVMVSSFLLSFFFLFLSRKKAIFFVLVSIFIYVVLSGFDAPIIRAGIMAGVTFWAQEEGKLVSAWRVLVLTALTMLLLKPVWISDLGFILSFVSTASLMLFEKGVREKLKFVPEVLKEGLSTSLAAQIGVGPILFVTFGQFNLLSPLINALVLWTIPYLMVLGALGGIIGLISPFLSQLVLYLSYPLTFWFVKVVDIFS